MDSEKKRSFRHVKNVLEKEYPLLKDLEGAFEILRSNGSRRVVEVIPIPPVGYTVSTLKDALGQAMAYIRPLQRNLELQDGLEVCI